MAATFCVLYLFVLFYHSLLAWRRADVCERGHGASPVTPSPLFRSHSVTSLHASMLLLSFSLRRTARVCRDLARQLIPIIFFVLPLFFFPLSFNSFGMCLC